MKALYEGIESHSEQQVFVYIAIICYVSNDHAYISGLQKFNIKTPTWFHDRGTRSISLGGLLILIILKCIQTNIQTFHSLSLHRACIAGLVNMAPAMVEMEPIVCQKLIVLLEQSCKRYFKSESTEWQQVHGDIISMILEICNTVIRSSLKSNSNLVYGLLQYPGLNDLVALERLQDLVHNVKIVVSSN